MKIIVPQEIASKIHNAVMESSPNEIKGALFAERLFDGCFQIDDVYISKKCGTHISNKNFRVAQYAVIFQQ